jgi:thiol-disulfide isomerase/thioredoxin
MKELIHFTLPGSTVCEEMIPIIDKLIKSNPDIHYIKVDVSNDSAIYEFYNRKYPMPVCPSFLGIVNGKVQDGHIGLASGLILESLVN